jgi:hypothetical protein
MTASGAVWTNKLQAAIEASRGTGIAATRLLTDIVTPVMITPKYTKLLRPSNRASLNPYFDAPINLLYSLDMAIPDIRPTYESLPWWLQFFVKGGVTGAMTNTTVYTYTFTPTGTADDLKTAVFEYGVDTAAYQASYGLGQKLSLSLSRTAGMKVTAEFLLAKEVAQAFTAALNPVAWEEINGALFTAWADTTTIGTTAITPVDFSLDIANNWQWWWAGDGNLYPGNAARKQFAATATLTTYFASTTERDAYTANTYRKIRVKTSGSTIPSSSPTTAKSMIIDCYGYWKDAVLSDLNGAYVLKSTADLVWDTTAAAPYSVAVANGLATLP